MKVKDETIFSDGEMESKMVVKEEGLVLGTGIQNQEKIPVSNFVMTVKNETGIYSDCEMESKMEIKDEDLELDDGLHRKGSLPSSIAMKFKNSSKVCGMETQSDIKREPWWQEITAAEGKCQPEAFHTSDLHVQNEIRFPMRISSKATIFSSSEVENKNGVKEEIPVLCTVFQHERKFPLSNPAIIRDETEIYSDCEMEHKIEIQEDLILDGGVQKGENISSSDAMKFKNNNNVFGLEARIGIKEELWCQEITSAEVKCHLEASPVSDLRDGKNDNLPAAESPRLHLKEASSAIPTLFSIKDLEENDSFKQRNDNPGIGTTNIFEGYSGDLIGKSCIGQNMNLLSSKKSKLQVCEEKSSAYSKCLKAHILIHGEKKPYQCNVCEKSFAERRSLKRHILIHEGIRPYKCNVCEKSYTERRSLNRHIKIHEGIRPYKCDICEKSFTQSGILKQHALIHVGNRPYKCDVCEKSFTLSRTLKNHILIHEDKRKFKCDVCEKGFIHFDNLKRHILIHEGKKPYKCNCCEKSFTQSGTLKKHIMFHEGKRAFKCDRCEKSFILRTHLKRHIVIHEVKKPYKCDLCEKRFTQLGHLKSHIRLHEGKMQFKCDVCKKSFTQSRTLKKHIVIHEGQRTFKCDGCEKSFTQLDNLKRHICNL